MKYFLKLGLILLIISAIASGILAFINSITRPLIEENERREKEEARLDVLPEAVTFDSLTVLNEETVYTAKDDSGIIVGYTFIACKYGYSSNVKTMVGLKPDLSINKVKIISQAETPGLGANCVKPEFQAEFADKTENELKVDKDGGDIISLTGATITTRTIANSIKEGLNKLKNIILTEEEVTE